MPPPPSFLYLVVLELRAGVGANRGQKGAGRDLMYLCLFLLPGFQRPHSTRLALWLLDPTVSSHHHHSPACFDLVWLLGSHLMDLRVALPPALAEHWFLFQSAVGSAAGHLYCSPSSWRRARTVTVDSIPFFHSLLHHQPRRLSHGCVEILKFPRRWRPRMCWSVPNL